MKTPDASGFPLFWRRVSDFPDDGLSGHFLYCS